MNNVETQGNLLDPGTLSSIMAAMRLHTENPLEGSHRQRQTQDRRVCLARPSTAGMSKYLTLDKPCDTGRYGRVPTGRGKPRLDPVFVAS